MELCDLGLGSLHVTDATLELAKAAQHLAFEPLESLFHLAKLSAVEEASSRLEYFTRLPLCLLKAVLGRVGAGTFLPDGTPLKTPWHR